MEVNQEKGTVRPAPKVSVLMPVYKTNEAHLRQAIESVLAQTFTDFEFLILDDFPADNREKIVKSYRDARIKYAQNEKNMGITPSRNKLVEMARGEYLAVFDHDDISLPKRFEKQVAYLDAHPECGVVGCKTQRMSDGERFNFPSTDNEIKLALMMGSAVKHPSSMIRRSVLMDNNIRYEEKFSPAEDYALWCRLIPYTNFHNLNEEVLFHYRDHEGNTSHLQSIKMENSIYAVRAFARAENPFLWENVVHITKLRVLGLPFLTKIKQGCRTKITLFNHIPLCSKRSRTTWRK